MKQQFMDLTITNDMTIKYITGGIEYILDRMILNQSGIDHVVYERGGGGGEIDYSKEYLTITSWEDNNTCVFHWWSGTNNVNSVSYSKDKTNWTTYTTRGTDISVSLDKGESVYFKGSVDYTNGFYYSTFDDRYSSFHCLKKWEVSGNLMSMVYGDNFINKTTFKTANEHCFLAFFCAGNNAATEVSTYPYLMSARNFVFPITQITGTPHGCFARMFQRQPLIYAPKEMTYNEGSTAPSNFFWGLFKDCTSLQETPLLKFTSFGSGTCANCFNNASSLKRCKSYAGSGSSQENFITASNGLFYIKNSSQTASNKPSSWTTRYIEGTSFISIWAEAETPYDGYIEGCSDYYVAGDTVTLIATNLNGTGFQGWYEDGQLVSSSSTYTFTASTSRNFTVRFRDVGINYAEEYFTITSWQDNNTIYVHLGTPNNSSIVDLSYSYDKTTWTAISGSVGNDKSITGVNKGTKIYIKGSNNRLSSDNFPNWETSFHASKKFEVSGNIMSLLWGENFIGKTLPPNTSDSMCFQNLFESVLIHTSDRANLLSTRNLVLPCTIFNKSMYESFFYNCTGLIYGPKEIPAQTSIGGNNALGNFYYGCSKIQETAKINVTSTTNSIFNNITSGVNSLQRAIFLTSSGYPSVTSSVKYKLSTNTSVSGSAYRDFDTLQEQGDFLSIWAETETPYDGIVAGCSDYFIAGESVTLQYVAVNGTFNGYYDENDNLLSSNSTYTFTAQRNMKIKVKTS